VQGAGAIKPLNPWTASGGIRGTGRTPTDPDARLYRKSDGRESRLCFMGHVLMENRNGLAPMRAARPTSRDD
jgi:hypothetical protein